MGAGHQFKVSKSGSICVEFSMIVVEHLIVTLMMRVRIQNHHLRSHLHHHLHHHLRAHQPQEGVVEEDGEEDGEEDEEENEEEDEEEDEEEEVGRVHKGEGDEVAHRVENKTSRSKLIN